MRRRGTHMHTPSRRLAPILLTLALIGNAHAEAAAGSEERVLVTETVVSASPADVWQAWTTAEGWKSWAVQNAWFDEWKVGANLETSYSPEAKRGDPTNIRQRVLAYLPLRMLAFQTTDAAPDFPHADLLPNLFCVVEIEALAERQTRVRLSMAGYRSGGGYDELWVFFERGNAYSLEQLRKRFAGP